jgi:hypothetical protein
MPTGRAARVRARLGRVALSNPNGLTLLLVPGRATPAVHNAMVRKGHLGRLTERHPHGSEVRRPGGGLVPRAIGKCQGTILVL